jgi:hypothetical protein
VKEIDLGGGRLIVVEFTGAEKLTLPLLLTPHNLDQLGLTDVGAGYASSAQVPLPRTQLEIVLRVVT